MTVVAQGASSAERDGRAARIAAAALPGTAAVAWMLFGGRWAAYFGAPPIFLTDILLAGGIAAWLLTRGVYGSLMTRRDDVAGQHPLLLLILVWTTVRFVAGGRLDVDAVRDAVPYFYVVAGIVAAAAVGYTSDAGRRRTVKVLLWALGLHALWVFVVVVVYPDLPNHMPVISTDQGLHIFKTRTDFEGGLVAIFASWLTVRLLRGDLPHPVWATLATAACWVTIFTQGSRAALLTALVVALVSVTSALRGRRVPGRVQLALVALLPLLLVVVVAVLPSTRVGQRLSDTFAGSQMSTTSAGGTTEARERTWRYLFEYSAETTPRMLLGVGYGPNFMADTRAGYLLIRSSDDVETNPRAPHNYELNTLLRGGLVALALFLALLLTVFARIGRMHRQMADDDFVFLMCLIPLATAIPATLGVVLESPFGAIPFFWATGVLLAISSSRVEARGRP